jgi:hypothetical protein
MNLNRPFLDLISGKQGYLTFIFDTFKRLFRLNDVGRKNKKLWRNAMKPLFSFAASLLLIASTSLAFAQDAATTPGEHSHKGKNPLFEKIKAQEVLIAADIKNGKLTTDTAAPLNSKLQSIKDEIKTDFTANKANGTRGLTEDQKTAIAKELEANGTGIPQ